MIKLGYFILFLAVVLIVLLGVNSVLKKMGFDQSKRIKQIAYVGIAITLWTVYTFVLSSVGFFQNFSLPPRFPIFLILPVFIFTGIFLYRNRNSEFIKVLPKSWVVYFQSFRIFVELLFAASFAEGLLHKEVTLHGYNYDILVGLTAPIIAYLAFNLKVISEKVVLIWNFIGLGILATVVALFMTTIFIPSLWGAEQTWATSDFAVFPYTLVAGFLMPIAIFMHIVSIIQLTRK